ncbi:hyaluronan synthase [Nocardiopsis terrae]|uniref:Hyaluronan synthase n=1 Tax=Nocardiopsis terrae TaxID=372655 RepID=A0ABR9H9Z3_9ACTN|nr:glycosyltransferase family 2 protein [Nocardiopsis terrae]MBE1455847.1 hyaluronan synthase [Nocardiopsis terrae]GHC92794.1 hyaluronan synthase [Nocardiopsis terrae]
MTAPERDRPATVRRPAPEGLPATPELPAARCAPPGAAVLCGALALAGFALWGLLHVFGAVSHTGSGGSSLALVWLTCFLLLWWVPLAWFEHPVRASQEQHRALDELTVTVQIPVYNEDPEILWACLCSVLAQSRPVQRVRVVDDGSRDAETGEPVDYAQIRDAFLGRAEAAGVEATWDRVPNRGKRFAQMHVLTEDDADVFVTLDSDSVMDRHAVREGMAPFADPAVQSVAGHVLVLNDRANLLTRMTCLLYLPFTRGLRSAQSVMRRVTINSGTLALYRADVVRQNAGAYENEHFWGRPMQMNDDSMLTFYALLRGDTVHQPSALVFTLVPERFGHYFGQQLRWMRGTTVRHLWWLRYMPLGGVVFWVTVTEYLHMLLGVAVPVAILADPGLREQWGDIALAALVVGTAISYVMALRIFAVQREGESTGYRWLLFLCAPAATVWRMVVLRPLYLFAVLTCRRIANWGTRERVEVAAARV